jgi:hypothetical protein
MGDNLEAVLLLVAGLYIMISVTWAIMCFQLRHFRNVEQHCAGMLEQMREMNRKIDTMTEEIRRART